MTLEQIKTLHLSAEQLKRVEAAFTVADRFKKICEFVALDTEEQVKAKADELVANYKKRLEAKEKAIEKKKLANEDMQKLLDVVDKAKADGYTLEDLINFINDKIKDKHNKDIKAKIAELEAQLIK